MDTKSLAPAVAERTRTSLPDSRAARALALYVEHFEEIALSFRAGVYKVPSCTGSAVYTVRLVPTPYCSCPDFKSGYGEDCKHIMVCRVVRKVTAPCSDCGRRFRYRDLLEVPDDHLTFFEGDLLCLPDATAHGVL